MTESKICTEAAAKLAKPKGPPKQADVLVAIAKRCTLFHSPDGAAFADIDIDGRRETLPVRMKAFRRWLAHTFYLETQNAPNAEAMQSALNVIEARALYEGDCHVVHIRVGGIGNTLYLDLGDDRWRAVEISTKGWKVGINPHVRFRRAAGMQALPIPERDGKIDTLRQFLNVQTGEQFTLVVAWLMAALRNCGPYPVLTLAGEQGSAKSTLSKLLRSLIDPNAAPLRALPREDRDLFIAATNAHVLVFDNVSGLPFWISDTLCRLATGGGFSVRQLYTDQDEILFDAQRPIILNGIEDIVSRPDLLDRSLRITLDPIAKTKRLPEHDIVARFVSERPKILGAMLDVMVRGLKRLPHTKLAELPRMADFAQWIVACEAGLWPDGAFISAYTGNTDAALKELIDDELAGTVVMEFMENRKKWEGTSKELLKALALHAGEGVTRQKRWPQSPRGLSGVLTRLAPSFRRLGLEVRRPEHGTQGRPVGLEWVGKTSSQPSQPSQTGEIGHSSVMVGDGRGQQPSHPNPLKSNGRDGRDGRDGQIPPYSGEVGDPPKPASFGRKERDG
jgi:hypothetical protein